MVEYMYVLLLSFGGGPILPRLISSLLVPCIISTLWCWYFKLGYAIPDPFPISGFCQSSNSTIAWLQQCPISKDTIWSRKDLTWSNFTLHVPAYTMVGRLGLAYLKHGNSMEFMQYLHMSRYGSYPYGNERPADWRLEDSSTLCASLSWILAWQKYKKRRRHTFWTKWFGGDNRHSSNTNCRP